eukprot:scaffold68297_cov120-Phaeocystis_antarctica.AAC.3
MAVPLRTLYEQPAGTTPDAPSSTLLKPPSTCSPAPLAASWTAAKHSSSVAPRRPAEHCSWTPGTAASRSQEGPGRTCTCSRRPPASGAMTAPSTRLRSISWRSADATPSSRRLRYLRKTFWARRAMHCSLFSFSGLSSDCTQLIVASALSLSEQPRPPPKRTVLGQLIAFGNGRLGMMSSGGAINTGRHPAAIESNRRRDVGVSPAGIRHSFESRGPASRVQQVSRVPSPLRPPSNPAPSASPPHPPSDPAATCLGCIAASGRRALVQGGHRSAGAAGHRHSGCPRAGRRRHGQLSRGT